MTTVADGPYANRAISPTSLESLTKEVKMRRVRHLLFGCRSVTPPGFEDCWVCGRWFRVLG
jgi:hypothetical protein